MTFDLRAHRSIGDAFTHRVTAHPERTAVTIYRGSAATEHDTVTYAELARRARSRATELAARLDFGERVLIALPTCVGFAEWYLGCLLAGLVAVPVPLPGSSAKATERVAAIAGDCTPGLAVTTAGDRDGFADRMREYGQGGVPVMAMDDVPLGSPEPLRRNPDRDSLAVIQYSSGSTGTPKGVVLSHGDVMANVEAFSRGCEVGQDDSFGAWLPLHHDMGLFSQLTAALVFGVHSVLMSPSDFVRRPIEWFRMMDRFGTTVTAAPSFAYDLCLRLISDDMLEGVDLSRLRMAFNGSEPIHVPTMAEFTKRFARAGLGADVVTPAYGMAEATVYVCTKAIGRPPTVLVADPRRAESPECPELRPTSGVDGKEITGVGWPAGLDLRIVDPSSHEVLADGAIGEIWLRGASIGRGYWNRPELSRDIFAAHVADGDGSAWLRTGDLGAVVGGELFVTGRLKELLIVRGRNIAPQDVEQAARAAHDALTGYFGAAFGVPVPDERIVLVHEVAPNVKRAELPGVAAAVVGRLAVEFGGPARNVVLVRRGTVRRTTSGKIQRAATRAAFLAGDVEWLHAELEPDVRAVFGSAAHEGQPR
jgi:acyl-CoA synthetase (AMP-forming)/AMP-acid ligase II